MSWSNRVWQEFHAGNLTRGFRDVLLTLATYRGHGGIAWPSHETLADRARCCVRTVQRALAAARELGLVTWAERRVRAGWRWLRTSNVYRFSVPAGPVATRLTMSGVRTWSTTGQKVREGESQLKKKELTAFLAAGAAAGSDLLARRRQMLEARWRGAAIA
jgi:Helix-turn-helix domain